MIGIFLIRTLFALKRECIELPGDMRCLIEMVYSDRELPAIPELQWISDGDLEAARINKVKKENKEAGESATYLIRQPDVGEFSFHAMARPCAIQRE